MICPHFAELVFIQAKKYGDKNAMYFKNAKKDIWEGISWNTFASQIKSVAKAMFDIGISSKDKVAIFSQNKPECFVVDFALFANRAVSVPVYATSTENQLEFIVKDAEISTVFVGEQYQFDIAYDIMKTTNLIKHIIIFDGNVKCKQDASVMYLSEFMLQGQASNSHFEVQNIQGEASVDDLASILYTSGTSGNSKGAMLSHENYLSAVRLNDLRLKVINDEDTSICFLPVSHIFERVWSYYCLAKGVEIYVNLNPVDIQQTIKEVRPTLMCSVPRFWEKVYAGVLETVGSYNPFMQGVVSWSGVVGSKYNLDHLRLEKKPSFWLCLSYALADKLIFSKVKKAIGLDKAKILPTAGAALSDEINIFFKSIGVPILYGYGLTETTATVSCFTNTNFEIGTVGKVLPELEVKIGEDNEILIKGKTVIKSYYNSPEVNAIAFTEDGFFRTGDAGYIENNILTLTDRIKDLFKTSNGKYIAPQHIETTLIVDKYIDQVATIGDQRNFVSAIIVPNMVELKKLSIKEGVDYESLDKLLKDKKIIKFYEKRINELQKDMARFEQIKRFVLIKNSFTIESGELTNTLKLRRPIILHKYKRVIDIMYKDV